MWLVLYKVEKNGLTNQTGLGLGELCLSFLYCAMPAIPGNVTIMLQKKLYYAHIMLNYVMAFYL